mmetsp:Transcript_2428/g.5154  ORF Transcript_2428/g.5154 Transcript_2428/m.5154 type:complete len:309 (-) Transcript_2428:9-935(-)
MQTNRSSSLWPAKEEETARKSDARHCRPSPTFRACGYFGDAGLSRHCRQMHHRFTNIQSVSQSPMIRQRRRRRRRKRRGRRERRARTRALRMLLLLQSGRISFFTTKSILHQKEEAMGAAPRMSLPLPHFLSATSVQLRRSRNSTTSTATAMLWGGASACLLVAAWLGARMRGWHCRPSIANNVAASTRPQALSLKPLSAANGVPTRAPKPPDIACNMRLLGLRQAFGIYLFHVMLHNHPNSMTLHVSKSSCRGCHCGESMSFPCNSACFYMFVRASINYVKGLPLLETLVSRLAARARVVWGFDASF